jgi:FkbH-like protein
LGWRVKLIEALETLRRPASTIEAPLRVFLACGMTPLHLQTFLAAHLRSFDPDRAVTVETGLFGDLSGNMERWQASRAQALVVVIEWSDLDPRLGVRTLGGWRPSEVADIVASASGVAARVQKAIEQASGAIATIVSMPSLPLPPVFSTSLNQAGDAEMQLRLVKTSLAESVAKLPGVRLVNPQALDENSPLATRYDLKSDVLAGFPYTLKHASETAKLLASLVQNRPPKKGLITDLDDTLWAGILGEDGVDGISWHLDRHTHLHGMYQQMVASLAGAGVLVGVASKNDAANVQRAFERKDLLVSKSEIFPFETHWSRKSESVRRILETWNVGADSVVFVDDSPMEVAEVQAAFPELECIVFPKGDYQGIWSLLLHLREIFGKPILTADDQLRLRSIREAGAWREASRNGGGSTDEFLQNAEARITFESVKVQGDPRALELVNKTNQFNLNGKRLSEADWQEQLRNPSGFTLTVSYQDKYGPLGKIAVIAGECNGNTVRVSTWVMSCRAFSRRIEHQCLKYLFETLGAENLIFEYQETPRNGPLQEVFSSLLGAPAAPGCKLTREQFAEKSPRLFHQVEGMVHV